LLGSETWIVLAAGAISAALAGAAAGRGHAPPQPAPGSRLTVVRPHRAATPSRPPRPRPSRPPYPLFPRTASKLIVTPRSLPAPGLPKGLLIVLVMAPCVAAAVTRFARGR
jgi:hypothetical protein